MIPVSIMISLQEKIPEKESDKNATVTSKILTFAVNDLADDSVTGALERP